MRLEGWTLILLLFAGLLAGGGEAVAEPGSARLAGNPQAPAPSGPSGGDLRPGGVLVFDGHAEDDGVRVVTAVATGGAESFIGLPVGLGLARIATRELGTPSSGVEVRLLSRATAVPIPTFIPAVPLAPSVAETEIYEYVGFEVNADDDDSEGTALRAQVTGRVDIRGWLALVGYGRVKARVFVELEDVSFQDENGNNTGLGADYPRYVVHREQLANYELRGTLGLGLSGSAKVEAGSLTAAEGGVGLTVSIDLPLGLQVVRDSLQFGFLATVQRGHSYRVRLTLASRAGQRLGIGWAAFGAAQGSLASSNTAGDSEAPVDLLDPDVWLDTLTLPFLDRGLPDLRVLDDDEVTFTIPALSLDIPGAKFGLPAIENLLTRIDTDATLAGHTLKLPARTVSFPLPSLVTEALDRLPKTPREALRSLLGGGSLLQQSADANEQIEDPGVQLVRLEVMLEQDVGAEIRKAIKKRRRR